MAVATLAALRLDQRVVLARPRRPAARRRRADARAARRARPTCVAVVLLVVVAVVASMPLPAQLAARSRRSSRWSRRSWPARVMLLLEPLPETLLPYLIAPALAAGLTGGARIAVMTTGLGALVLLLGQLVGDGALVLEQLSGGREPMDAHHARRRPPRRVGRPAAADDDRADGERRLRRGVPADLAAAARGAAALRRPRPGQPRPADARAGPPGRRRSTAARCTSGRAAAGLSPVTFLGADRLDWDVDSPLFDEAWASSTRDAVVASP